MFSRPFSMQYPIRATRLSSQAYSAPQQSYSSSAYSDPLSCVIEPVGGKGGLYLSGINPPSNYDMLSRNGIEAVLTVAAGTGLRYHSSISHEVIQADDVSYYDLSMYFEQTYRFIEKHRRFTNVLVHCFAGVSRSVSIVIAYLMKKNGWKYLEAFEYVRARRSFINPNPGFRQQLQMYESKLAMEAMRRSNIVYQDYNSVSSFVHDPSWSLGEGRPSTYSGSPHRTIPYTPTKSYTNLSRSPIPATPIRTTRTSFQPTPSPMKASVSPGRPSFSTVESPFATSKIRYKSMSPFRPIF